MSGLAEQVKSAITDFYVRYPVPSLIIASFLCFAFVLFVSAQTISPANEVKSVTSSKKKTTKSSRGKSPARRPAATPGVRKSTRKRRSTKVFTPVENAEGKSYK